MLTLVKRLAVRVFLNHLGAQDTRGVFSTIFHNVDNFYDFLLVSLHAKLRLRANCSLLEKTAFQKGGEVI